MNKSDILNQVAQIYSKGGNIIQFLRGLNYDLTESIMISYEFQAGKYIEAFKRDPDKYYKYSQQMINELRELGSFDSILEAGVGEATTFKNIINSEAIRYNNYYAFDISWSRLKLAKDFLRDTKENNKIFVAELASIPLCDNSIDIVYTAHSVEPNRGNEHTILQELFRVAKRYLVLFEPDYELADDEVKARMDKHSYVRGLADIAKELGYHVIKRERLEYSLNPLNPTSVIIIKKPETNTTHEINPFQCPITKTELVDCGEVYYAPNPHLMYPVIQGIPYLLDSHAILGCKYQAMMK